MRQGLKRLCRMSLLGLPLAAGLPALAQQPVVEDLTGGGRSFYDQTATRQEAGGSLVLFNQVQSHQEELRQLRGQVEELRYQLEQLRRQTRQQYLDLEEQLMAAGSAAAAPPIAGAVDDQTATQVAEGEVPDEQHAERQADNGTNGDADPAARSAYQAAFAKVQAREFDAAIGAFEAFISDYPDDRLTANAHYWLGELYAAESELEPAEASFRRVLDDFPESGKVPDALYKLGLLKARQGEPDASRELLERVREEYPESSAAGLAGDFLRQSGN